MTSLLRYLGYGGALLLGLVLALGLHLRLHHLRLAMPDALPGWTATLSPDAGLRRGRTLPVTGLPAVEWRAELPRPGGPVWRLRATGPGTDLSAVVLGTWWLDGLAVTELSGVVDLALLPEGPWSELGGTLTPERATVLLDRLWSGPQWTADVRADWQAANYQGVPLGGGPVELQLDPLGSWRLNAALSGGVSDLAVAATGRLPASAVGLTLTIEDSPELPTTWRNAVRLAGTATQTGWRIEQRLDLR